jgi:hypothetical protein
MRKPGLPFWVKLAASIAIGAVSSWAQTSDSEMANQVLQALQNKTFLSSDFGDLPAVLAILTSGTRFAHQVNINKPVRESGLNVYLMTPDNAVRANLPTVIYRSKLVGNCAFIGISNAIVCDPRLINGFLIDHGAFNEVPDSVLAQTRLDYQYAFLAWVLGHELGHVMGGGGTAHFGQTSALDAKVNANVQIGQQSENAADLFAAKQIASDKHLTVLVERMLISLIDQEVAVKNGKPLAEGAGLHWDYANRGVVQYFANQDHPEFVVRATRILTVLASITGDEALKSLLETFTRHLIQVPTTER